MSSLRWALAAMVLLTTTLGCSQSAEYRPYPSSSFTMKVGSGELTVEVAGNDRARQQGLMHRTSMPEDHGMLFVYKTPNILNFWMKNTFIPLSIAFIADDGTIVNIEEMQPLVEAPGAVSLAKVKYALEVNSGWFERHGVEAGSQIEWPPKWLEELNIQEG